MNDLIEPPIYVVNGANWSMTVVLDEYNAQFDVRQQMHEAATRAIEVLEKMRSDFDIVMHPDAAGEKVKIGTTLLVHTKEESLDKAEAILTHVCMGNTGLYEKSKAVGKLFDREMAKFQAEQELREKKADTVRKKKTRKGTKNGKL